MKVLLVDDDADIRMVADVALRKVGGWEVTLAESGPDALQRLETLRPDVIILDMMMPGMDGLGTLKALRRRSELSHIPVIFMTAKVQSKHVDSFLEAGAVGCIAKPFDPLQLSLEVSRLLVQTPRP